MATRTYLQSLLRCLESHTNPAGSVRHVFTVANSKVKSQELAQLLTTVPSKLLINGDWVESLDGSTLPVIDPRTEKEVFKVASGGAGDVDKAVMAARQAFDKGPWPKMTARERGRILYKLGDLMEKHADALAKLETLDNGKPLFYSSIADVPLSYNHFRYFAGWADKIHGKTIPVDGAMFALTLHEPIGVVGQIIPWNFPLLMAAWKLAPALACGNTVVLKVSEQTPLTALKLGELALEAGLPPGVLNIITGYGHTAGAALTKHPDIDKIAFTGSTEVGRIIGRLAGEALKPATLELGGKSPAIVCPDVDVELAVQETHNALFFNHGQCCAAGSRLFVHEKIYDEFVARSADYAVKRRVGDPFTDVDQGPQVDDAQFKKIMSYIDKGNKEGARLVCGGKRLGNEGYYVEPTVFADVSDQMAIAREEIFGPVQCITKYKTFDEVIERSNSSNYGLAAGIFSNNINTINRLTRGLRSGTVWVNCYNIYDAAVPFGGYKDSGIGREKGEYALHNYTQVKAVYMPLEEPAWK